MYGVPDERMGEELCASVIIKEGSTLTEADIKSYCKGKVSLFYRGTAKRLKRYPYCSDFRFPISRSPSTSLSKKAIFPKQDPAKYKSFY